MKIVSAFLMACGFLSAQSSQAPNPTQGTSLTQSAARSASESVPVYRISVVARTTKAINYNHRSGSTRIDFRGTALMPQAVGEAKVESKQGVIKIDAEMQKLVPATTFGPEYLTYVMWAITPEGRATNVGEVLLKDGKSKLNATSELQSFALIITAEPYFAVTQPSDVVVMENFVRHDTTGTIEQVDAKYELLKRGQYVMNVTPAEIIPMRLDPKVPLELYEARNAVQIARWTGAQRYASDTFSKAEIGLLNAEGYLTGKAGSKPIGTVAREAVQMAEDSRIITIKKIQEEDLANERQAAVDRDAQAEKAQLAAKAEAERLARDHEAQTVAAQAASDRLKSETEAQKALAQAETDRLKRENIAAQASLDKASADAAKAEAEKAKSEAEKVRLRAQLLLQFNTILQTRDTARGLIVNMSDVLFDTAKFSLRPLAREKLARVAGILAGYPGLRMQVEGYTDSVGSDDYNQQLSENRASSVRHYLTEAGIPSASVTASGFGKSQPVASNDTSAGRQQNRRVELVVSGDIIGSEIGLTPTGGSQ